MVILVTEMPWLEVFIPEYWEHRSGNDKQSDLVEREVASKPRAWPRLLSLYKQWDGIWPRRSAVNALRAKTTYSLPTPITKPSFHRICIDVNLQNTLTTRISKNCTFIKINRLQTKKRRITTLNTGLIQKAKIHVILFTYLSFDVGR